LADHLSLHHLTVREVDSATFIDIAAAVGCTHACLFVDVPKPLGSLLPSISTIAEAESIARRMRNQGLEACSLDFFIIDESFSAAACHGAFERGAILGGSRATVQVKHPDEGHALDLFRALGEVGAEYGIALTLEFTGMASIASIDAAADFVLRAKVSGAALVADPLHLFRTGGTAEDIKRHASLIGYAQICDGLVGPASLDYRQEALFGRMVPGSGDFPLVQFVSNLPKSALVSVEAPFQAADPSTTAQERAKRAVEGARAVLSAARTRGGSAA